MILRADLGALQPIVVLSQDTLPPDARSEFVELINLYSRPEPTAVEHPEPANTTEPHGDEGTSLSQGPPSKKRKSTQGQGRARGHRDASVRHVDGEQADVVSKMDWVEKARVQWLFGPHFTSQHIMNSMKPTANR